MMKLINIQFLIKSICIFISPIIATKICYIQFKNENQIFSQITKINSCLSSSPCRPSTISLIWIMWENLLIFALNPKNANHVLVIGILSEFGNI